MSEKDLLERELVGGPLDGQIIMLRPRELIWTDHESFTYTLVDDRRMFYMLGYKGDQFRKREE
jgi:hypothetical protein